MLSFYRKFVMIIILGFIFCLSIAPVSAQSRSVFWQEWNVYIENVDTTRNEFDVREEYVVDFTGTFRFGTAVIPTDRLGSIANVEVFEDGVALQSVCSDSPGTFCYSTTTQGIEIVYNFRRPLTNATQEFEIRYTVSGALRIYEGGDQLWWMAVPDEHYGFSIGESTVQVTLPRNSIPREGVDPIEVYGAPATVQQDGSVIRATTTRGISGSESFEIRIQYPHNSDALVPYWQEEFDRQQAFDETVRPILDVVFAGLSMLLGLGGPLAIFLRWQTRGRDPRVGIVPEYLADLPSDLPPAVVGALIDERVDVRDVISTVMDLARREYLVIEEQKVEGFLGLGRSSTFVFKRTDKEPSELRSFEQRIYNGIFTGGRDERTLTSMQNTFYATIAVAQSEIYGELTRLRLFSSNPESVRSNWSGGGVALLVLAFLGVFFGLSFVEETGFTYMLLGIPIALGIIGFVMMAFNRAMPVRTAYGAEETAKWRAFLRYMRSLERYSDIESVSARFADFLPYAVAFGINRDWINQFRGIENVPLPPWYFPMTGRGPYRGGYVPRTPLSTTDIDVGRIGELARAGGSGGLDDLSGGLSGGLDSISDGLTNFLNLASTVMTSRPASSSSGGRGGSWSGGGFSGGASGGGSRGFG
jgi:uncharacterized membrane protein YgcG